MGVRIRVGEREPVGLALKRLRKALERQGIAREMRQSRYFIKPTELRRRKKFLKLLKSQQATRQEKGSGKQSP
jgi:small subunit ribosomal protein S21